MTALECADIFTYDFLMYYEKMTMEMLHKDYIVILAGFLGTDLNDDPEKLPVSEEYQKIEKEYATGLMFYNTSRPKLYQKLNEYQRRYIEAYSSIISTLDMNIRMHLDTDDLVGVDGIRMEILEILNGNVNIPIKPGTPVFLPVLEAIYPIFMANDLMECCLDHIIDKCRDEYMAYISEFTCIEYDEVFDTVMNE